MSSFTMRISDTYNDLGKAMQTITTDVQKVEGITLNKAAKIIKTRVEGNLRALQKPHYNKKGVQIKRPREIHMADDVNISYTKDKFGYRCVRIQGGTKTGTLWHVVNDGTYRSVATHFMDKSMEQSEADIQRAIDEELRRVFQ